MALPKTGEMCHVLKFELINKSGDDTGGVNEGGVEWFTCRGLFKKLSGHRRFESGYDATVNAGEMFVPWRQEIENNISKDVRIVYDNRFFAIDNYDLVGEKRRMYHIEVREVR